MEDQGTKRLEQKMKDVFLIAGSYVFGFEIKECISDIELRGFFYLYNNKTDLLPIGWYPHERVFKTREAAEERILKLTGTANLLVNKLFS